MGSVPLMYQGSKYAPGPMVEIPGPPPLFLSAEIGAVNASTVAVLFDSDVSASNYATGVTIKVNGTATSITSATRQTNHAIVRYVIPVLWHGSGDTVIWEYASGSGNIIAENGGAALGDVTAQSVLNNVEYAALLDLQADTLALNDADPVSTWADQSGNGHDFTQTGTARPTKQTENTYPVVIFDGVDDWLEGGDFAGSLESFSIIVALKTTATNGYHAIAKLGAPLKGWSLGAWGFSAILFTDDANYIQINEAVQTEWRILTGEFLSVQNGSVNMYVNGSNSSQQNASDGIYADAISSTANISIGWDGPQVTSSGFTDMNVHAILIYSSAPAATNRAALEARLAARYGITL